MDQAEPPKPSSKEASGPKTPLAQGIEAAQQGITKRGLSPTLEVGETMKRHPELRMYVMELLTGALSDEERRLIADTASTTYTVTDSLVMGGAFTAENTDLQYINEATAVAVETDVLVEREDNNEIFEDIQTDMERFPELQEYVTSQMRKSVTPQEANLVGNAALVTFNVLRGLSAGNSGI